MSRSLESMIYEDRLKKLVGFNLEWKRKSRKHNGLETPIKFAARKNNLLPVSLVANSRSNRS